MYNNSILLNNCAKIATFNKNMDELDGYDILIKGNRIEKIGPFITLSPEEKENTEIINCEDYLVIPGMVNTHHHLFQNLTRNYPGAQNKKLFDWLTTLYPIWEKIDEEALYWSTVLGCGELLKTGATTTFNHHYLYPQDFYGDPLASQIEGASDTGIRFCPSRGSMTVGEENGGLSPESVVEDRENVIRNSIEVVEKYHDSSPLSMLRIVLAPCSPFSIDKELMRETAEIGRNYEVALHTHLAETQDEVDYCRQKFGLRPLELMSEVNWLGEDVSFAHGIYFTDRELELIAETGTSISHCPTSNMRLGSGVARIKEMLDLGINVGLGVDGSASNDSSDMLGEVRNAMLLQRIKYGSESLTAREAFLIAIKGGSKILKYRELGTIEEGMGADLSLFNIKDMQYAGGLSDALATIVFSGYDHSTSYTIVNGKIVVSDGKLVNFEEEEITEKVNRISRRLLNSKKTVR